MAAPMSDFRVECKQLLLNLKSTVEGLLANHTTNVWNTYGGLSRLSKIVDNILRHRLKGGTIDEYWNFIVGLRVVVPTLAPWLERHRTATEGDPSRRSFIWVQQRLQEHSLTIYLKILLAERSHLDSCYHETAFLRQEDFGRALLVCLSAVENNQMTILADLDPTLLVEEACKEEWVKGHKRSPSLPNDVSKHRSFGFVTREDDETVERSTVQLRRQKCLDRAKGEVYRSAVKYASSPDSSTSASACQQAQIYLKKHSLLSKSHTWNGQLVSVLSDKDVRNVVAKRRRSEPYSLASREEPVTVRPSVSFPILNRHDGNDQKLSNEVETTKVTMETKCTLPINYDGESSLESSFSGTVQSTTVSRSKSTESCSVLQPQTQPQRSPSHHVRSRSDVTSDVKVTLTNVSLNLPVVQMSSSLPTTLRDNQLGPIPLSADETSTPIFRRPVEGQSLTSFLSSQDFRTCAELDKENAHFSISEALISAIEQIKCNQSLRIAEEENVHESDDEEIKQLQQRIRIRRRERLQEKTLFKSPQALLLSDGRTDTPTTTTSQSPSPQSSSSDGNSSDSVEPLDVSDGSEVDSKLSTLHESGLSLSMASLYSDADIRRPLPTPLATNSDSYEKSEGSSSCYVSAESVALSLIRKFSEKQLPKASDLEWLVSEQDAPQKVSTLVFRSLLFTDRRIERSVRASSFYDLRAFVFQLLVNLLVLLPLPSSWPVSPDDAEKVQHLQTRLRGNHEWAPPRPQIIFNVHPSPQRKVIIAKQNYRCAGCGNKVEKGFMARFRYCEYLGKYFCQCCHNNYSALIPGRILRKWDFTRFYVSNFSRDLLEKIFSDPLYDLSQINPSLYRRVRSLTQVQQIRLQLFHVKDFIRTCRKCDSLVAELEKQPPHIVSSPNQYSICDLLQVKNGEMLVKLRPLLTRSLAHIENCQLCQARGFFCEFCKNDEEVIFPFQLDTVKQCTACWACYHIECYIPNKCPKCVRIELRRQRLQEVDADEN